MEPGDFHHRRSVVPCAAGEDLLVAYCITWHWYQMFDVGVVLVLLSLVWSCRLYRCGRILGHFILQRMVAYILSGSSIVIIGVSC